MTYWPSMDGEEMMPVEESKPDCGAWENHDFEIKSYTLPIVSSLGHSFIRRGGGLYLECKRCGRIEPA